MKKRIQTTSIALALLLALTGLIAPRAERTVTASSAQPVVAATAGSTLSALPASDMIFYFDMQRFFNDTLPNFLGANSPVITDINKKLDEAQKETGINPRSFDSMAVGVRLYPQSPNKVNVVALAHGDFVAADLINTGFAAAQRKHPGTRHEEQQYGGKTVYVMLPDVAPKVVVEPPPATAAPKKGGNGAVKPQKLSADRNSLAKKMDDPTPCDASSSSTLNSATQQTVQAETKKSTPEIFAVVALDNSTIAFGNLDSVKAAIDAGTAGHERVSEELVTLATQTPNSIFGFSGNVPPTLAKDMGINLSNEKQMKMLNSVHKFYGAVSTAGTEAESLIALLTGTSDEARDLGQTLNGLKAVAGLATPSKGTEPLMQFLDKLTITTQNNEVQLKVKVSQADILPLTKSF
jgi:hypothetical protein